MTINYTNQHVNAVELLLFFELEFSVRSVSYICIIILWSDALKSDHLNFSYAKSSTVYNMYIVNNIINFCMDRCIFMAQQLCIHLIISTALWLSILILLLQLFSTAIIKSAVHVSSSWSLPSSRLWVSGDLLLYQRTPLPASGRITKYNTSFFNDSSFATNDYELTNILREIHDRNG